MDDEHQCSTTAPGPPARPATPATDSAAPVVSAGSASDPAERASLSILYSFPHAIGSPGIGWTALHQVRVLTEAGHRVTVVAASLAAELGPVARVVTTLTVAGVRLPHRLFGRNRSIAHHDRVTARILAEGDYDVVHGWPWGSARTFDEAARQGVPSVREAPNTHTAHAFDVVAEEYERLGITPPPGSPHTYNATRLRREEREWAAATAILVPSASVEHTFLEKGFSPRKLLRHRYGALVDTERLVEPDPRDASDHVFTAVFVGRIEPRKGLLYALQAWHASTASATGRFLVYGEFTPGYRERLDGLLDQPSVELRGFTDDVAGVFATADVLILPTIEEGSALVTSEAQAAGCVPLVSSAAGANLEDGVQGLVHEPRDVEALTAHLDRVSSDRELLARMRRAAFENRRELTWERAGVDLVAAYRAAIRLVREEAAPRQSAVGDESPVDRRHDAEHRDAKDRNDQP
ncbi:MULTISPECIES: glycosyltransferase family 4 protein [unclassified Rathayibacter]|uniref:glycosyltransferase family 4 protein n=1 Tax=unclassified Rathayibacter TaxID=2609250 RepID=UPI00188C5B21|nr:MULTISPECIES: glycosyltransferase family 4 protein [unclassified Rathayibacter]MBF4461272.1 glycosyltransferase family 4 protein [Rathayibacter sp. VKM Ac-2879]MBF4502683.1 glycosyltransferase family 4 protein [Rathayibacter sp. VKM Ac-2878]